jgi:uncharacterized protein YdhG (YjbR/CyaY superfamily)
MAKVKAATVDEYIANAPSEAKPKLRELREILREVAPNAVETIKWGAPIYEENRILFSMSAFKKHLTFMPTRSTLDAFKDELANFETGRDTLQIPYDKPLPKALIKKLAKHRRKDVIENDAKWMHSS